MVTEYAWIITWWLFCLLTGSAVLTRLKLRHAQKPMSAPNREIGLFFCMTTGLGLQIILLVALALAGLLSTTPTLIALLTLAVISYRIHRNAGTESTLSTIFAPVTSNSLLYALPLLFLICAWLVKPLAPGMGHDEISYHLPYARFYLQNGGLAVNEYLRYPLHTHNFNMLYTLALMRDSVSMAHLMHASAGFITMLGVYGYARLWLGIPGAFVAVCLLLTVGVLPEAFGSAFVDLGLMLFVSAAMFALVLWQSGREKAWLILSAAFLGMAFGTKYLGLLFALPLGAWVLWVDRKPGAWLRFVLLTGIFGLFWYIRSWIISGNPVHPFLGELFGYYIWTQSDLLGQWQELQSHGVAHTLLNFFSMPNLLFTRADEFNGYAGLFGILVGGFYLGLLFWRQMPAAMRPMALVSLVYFVFWFNSSQVLRYLLPIAPVMALIAGLAVTESGKNLLNWWHRLKPGFTGPPPEFFMIILVAVSAVYCGVRFRGDLETISITPVQKDIYLRKYKEGYELFRAASEDPRIGAGPLMQFHLEGSVFYFPGMLVGDWTGTFAYTKFMDINEKGLWQLPAAEKLAIMLKQSGIRGVAFHNDTTGMFYPQDLGDYDRFFEEVYKNGFGLVMVPRAEPRDSLPSPTDLQEP